MMTLNADDYEKIRLLDILFNTIDVQTLKSYTESEEVVAKLKGIPTGPGILNELVSTQTMLHVDSMNMRAEITILKADLGTLIKCLNSSIYGYNQDFQNLKQKHNVY